MATDPVELACDGQELLERLRDTLLEWGNESEDNQENFIHAALTAQSFLLAETFYTIRHDSGEITTNEVKEQFYELVDRYFEQMRLGKNTFVQFKKSKDVQD